MNPSNLKRRNGFVFLTMLFVLSNGSPVSLPPFSWLITTEAGCQTGNTLRRRPLTLSQIEALIYNDTPDSTIAIEIRNRGISFTPDAATLKRLSTLRAGPKTIRELTRGSIASVGKRARNSTKCPSVRRPPIDGPAQPPVEKSGRILLLVKEDINGHFVGGDIIVSSLSLRMAEKNLSVTRGSEIGESNLVQLKHNLQQLLLGDATAGTSLPFAVIVEGTISTTSLEPFQGLYTSLADGSLRAIGTSSGWVIASESVADVRGFGNTPEEAARNALKNAAEKIRALFIDKVSKAAQDR